MIDIIKACLALLQFLLEGRKVSKEEEKIRLESINIAMEKRREDLKAAAAAGDVSAVNRTLSGV